MPRRTPSKAERRRLAPTADPRVIALLEAAFMQALRRMHRLAMSRLTFTGDTFHEDAPRVTIKGVRATLAAERPGIAEAVARAAAIADRVNRAALVRIPGIDPAKVAGGADKVSSFRARAVGLVRTLEAQYLGDLERVLAEGQGLHVKALTERIQERFDVTESRAKFWARDQTLKLNSAITKERMVSAGIVKYVGTTANDERVRGNPGGKYPDAEPSHWEREGKEYSFDDPPEDGHPGIAFNCRCVMYPVL